MCMFVALTRQQLGEAVKEGKDEVDAGEALREENKRLSAQVQQLAKVRGRGPSDRTVSLTHTHTCTHTHTHTHTHTCTHTHTHSHSV